MTRCHASATLTDAHRTGIALWLSAAIPWLALVAWALARESTSRRRAVVLPKGATSPELSIERCAFHGIAFDVDTEMCPGCAAGVRRTR